VSTRHSRRSMPSVIYLIAVSGDVQSSNRIVYPTCIRQHTSAYVSIRQHQCKRP
jgi:hypothetical protein